jgi:hypothetical protein
MPVPIYELFGNIRRVRAGDKSSYAVSDTGDVFAFGLNNVRLTCSNVERTIGIGRHWFAKHTNTNPTGCRGEGHVCW